MLFQALLEVVPLFFFAYELYQNVNVLFLLSLETLLIKLISMSEGNEWKTYSSLAVL